jgi:hypothetical protein
MPEVLGGLFFHIHGVMYEVQKYVFDACFALSCVNHWVCNGSSDQVRHETVMYHTQTVQSAISCVLERKCLVVYSCCQYMMHVQCNNISMNCCTYKNNINLPHLNIKSFFKLSIRYHFVRHSVDGYPFHLLLRAVCVKKFITPKPIQLSQTHFYNFWFSVASNLVLEMC